MNHYKVYSTLTMFFRTFEKLPQISYLKISFLVSDNSLKSELLRERRLAAETALKTQAVNKLAELMQKDAFGGKRRTKSSSQDSREIEMENKKIKLELKKVK